MFRAIKRIHIAALEAVWDAYEGCHISHIFRMVQDSYRDCLATSHMIAVRVHPRRRSTTHTHIIHHTQSSQRRNSAPGIVGREKGSGYILPANHNQRYTCHPPSLSQLMSLSQPLPPNCMRFSSPMRVTSSTNDGYGLSEVPPPKATIDQLNADRYNSNLLWQERKWLAIDGKFGTLITNDDQKRTERDIIAKYSISSEDKSYLLSKILYDARIRRIEKYDESLRLQQKALEKNDVFTCADAVIFLKSGDEKGVLRMLKHKLQQVQQFSNQYESKRRSLPFIFYTAAVHDCDVHKCLRAAHKERRTFEFVYEYYSRFH